MDDVSDRIISPCGLSISFSSHSQSSLQRAASISVSLSTAGSSSCPLEYSDDNIDGDGFSSPPPSPVSRHGSNTEQEEECPRSDDGINREERNDEGSVNRDAEAAAIVANVRNASNENAPSDDAVQKIVPTAVSARRWKQTLSDCDARNAEGQIALSISSSNCFLEGMKLLIDRGADVNLRDIYMRTPLHLACENAESAIHHDCVGYLLENGASVDVRDARGRTPLHVAAWAGCAGCIRLLLDSGAGSNVRDAEGDTPLHVAARMGHFPCMEALSPGVRSDDSHSSVEPTSPSLLFDREGVVADDSAGGSFYLSPRGASFRSSPRGTGRAGVTGRPRQDNDTRARDESPRENLGETPRLRNDSGYFTARGGSAWVKRKYYSDERHENVRGTSSIDSDTSSSVADDEYESEDDSVNGGADPYVAEEAVSTWIYGCILHIALYSLHLLSTWSNRVCRTSIKESFFRSLLRSKHTDMTGTVSTKVKPGDANQFVQPPKHVAEAMERLRSTKWEKSNKLEPPQIAV
jgi:ankyrin repeat protein